MLWQAAGVPSVFKVEEHAGMCVGILYIPYIHIYIDMYVCVDI